MSKGKFDSQGTEALYKQEPDDQLGQSLDGRSWYGLYIAHEAGGGSIVIEDTYGNVGRVDYETTEALMLTWNELETEESLFFDSVWEIGAHAVASDYWSVA